MMCLYSEGSMCPRILSATAQSFSSNPSDPLLEFFVLSFFAIVLLVNIGTIVTRNSVKVISYSYCASRSSNFCGI